MIGLGTATAQLDTAVNIAFPAITRGFDLAIGDIQWVVICYVLAYASLLLALGRIGDTIGYAVVYRAGLVCSTVAFLFVGYAPNYGAMLAFRCLQGIGAALVLSCGAALITSLYSEQQRSRALGVYTMMMALGLMLGPLLGGVLVATWDWRRCSGSGSRSRSWRYCCCTACRRRNRARRANRSTSRAASPWRSDW